MIFTPALRVVLLTKVIRYCGAHLAEIAVNPYRDPAEQARMAKQYGDTIERAAMHMRGYRMVGKGGSAYWTRHHDVTVDMPAARWSDVINA